jgi:hypothetical protein
VRKLHKSSTLTLEHYRAVNEGAIGSVRERGDMMTAMPMAKEQERHVELSTYNLLSLSGYTQSSEVELRFYGPIQTIERV